LHGEKLMSADGRTCLLQVAGHVITDQTAEIALKKWHDLSCSMGNVAHSLFGRIEKLIF